MGREAEDSSKEEDLDPLEPRDAIDVIVHGSKL